MFEVLLTLDLCRTIIAYSFNLTISYAMPPIKDTLDSINNARLNIIAEKADLRYTAFLSKKRVKNDGKKGKFNRTGF